MIQALVKAAVGNGRVRSGLAALAAAAALPSAAWAHHGFRVDVELAPPPVVVVEPAPYAPPATQVWVEPVYRTVCNRQWVPETYQTVTARVWVPPATATQVQRVLVPDQYGWRAVVAYDGYGRRCRSRQYVLTAAAHYEDQAQPVVVTAGYYQDVPQQQLACEGHWAGVDRQELVSPGHWEATVEAVPFYPPPPRHHGFRLRLPF